MKVGILGATGATGQHLVRQAAETYGDDVIAFARDPNKIQYRHEKVTARSINLFDENSLAEAFKDCDVILSALGPSNHFSSMLGTTFYSESIKPIVTALRKANVKRFVAITSMCLDDDPSHPWFMRWLIKPLFLGRIFSDMEQYLLLQCPDIDYTIVRPANLGNGDMDGRDLLAEEDKSFSYKMTMSIPRADVAKYMLLSVHRELHVKKMVAIGLPEK